VRVEPGAPDAGGVRVADDEEREEDEESRDAGATRRRGG
jgi:hypothetical protein